MKISKSKRTQNCKRCNNLILTGTYLYKQRNQTYICLGCMHKPKSFIEKIELFFTKLIKWVKAKYEQSKR